MEREQKNQMLADLYALRAGMSAISIERDKFGVKEKAYSDAKRKVDCACYEYENAENFVSRCDEYDKKDSLQKTEEKAKLGRTFKKTVIGSLCAGIVGALIPWFFYFATSGDYEQDSKYGYSYWEKYLLVSACILGIIFVVGLAVALIVKVSNGKDLKKKNRRKIRKIETRSQRRKSAIDASRLGLRQCAKGTHNRLQRLRKSEIHFHEIVARDVRRARRSIQIRVGYKRLGTYRPYHFQF